MSKINAVNNKSGSIAIDPGASGDSFTQYDINTTGEFRTGVYDTDDYYRISQGSALGANDTIVITDSGEITRPLQPAFLATINDYINNQTGDGSVYTVAYSVEYFDNGGDYNNGTYTFAAPITGKYRFKASILANEVASNHTSGYLQIVTSNRIYRSNVINYWAPHVGTGVNAQINIGHVTLLCDMDASDTAIVQVSISGGAKQIEIGYTNRGIFSGELVC